MVRNSGSPRNCAVGAQLGTVQPKVPSSPRIAGSQAVEGNKGQTENMGNRKKSFLLRCLSTALYCLCLASVVLKIRNDTEFSSIMTEQVMKNGLNLRGHEIDRWHNE